MRALLASILVVFTVVPFTLVSPPSAEAARQLTLTKIQKRKAFVFVFLAAVKCNFAKSRISEFDAEAILDKEIKKEVNVDVVHDLLDFLNDKRVNDLNNLLAKYLYENSEYCNVPEKKIVGDNTEIFLELAELFNDEKPLASGKN